MPAMGLEPIRGCPQQILSLPRLPFRHAGASNNRVLSYHNLRLLASYLFLPVFIFRSLSFPVLIPVFAALIPDPFSFVRRPAVFAAFAAPAVPAAFAASAVPAAFAAPAVLAASAIFAVPAVFVTSDRSVFRRCQSSQMSRSNPVGFRRGGSSVRSRLP